MSLPTTEHFQIEVPIDRIQELTDALNNFGLDFEPHRDCFIPDPEAFLDGAFTGAETDRVQESMNEWLTQNNRANLLRNIFDQYSPEQRVQFLTLVNLHSVWNSDYSYLNLTEVATEQLDKFTEDNPSLFAN